MNFQISDKDSIDIFCEHYDKENLEIKYLEKIYNFSGKKVLDIGCGNGRFTFKVLELVKEVYAVDIDKKELDKFRDLLRERDTSKVNIVYNDFLEYKYKFDYFDIAVFTWSLYLIEDIEKAIQIAMKTINENGKILILQPINGIYERVTSKLSQNKNVYNFINKFRHMKNILDKNDIDYQESIIKVNITFDTINDIISSIENLNSNYERNINKFLKFFKDGKYILSDYVKALLLPKKF